MEEIRPNLFRLQIPLPDSPLKYLNSYVIKSEDRNLIIDTGLNKFGALLGDGCQTGCNAGNSEALTGNGQWLTSATLAFSHGANDAQKSVGVIAALLLLYVALQRLVGLGIHHRQPFVGGGAGAVGAALRGRQLRGLPRAAGGRLCGGRLGLHGRPCPLG